MNVSPPYDLYEPTACQDSGARRCYLCERRRRLEFYCPRTSPSTVYVVFAERAKPAVPLQTSAFVQSCPPIQLTMKSFAPVSKCSAPFNAGLSRVAHCPLKRSRSHVVGCKLQVACVALYRMLSGVCHMRRMAQAGPW
jgi:hypothetical protein